MVAASQFIRQTLERDPKRRQEMVRYVVLPTEYSSGVLTTKVDVPQGIFANGRVYDYVGSKDGMNPYTYVSSLSKVRYLQSSKFARSENKFYVIDGENNGAKLQLYPAIGTPDVRIETVFADLEAVHRLNAQADKVDFWESDLRIPKDVINIVLTHLKQHLQIEPKENAPDTTSQDS